MWPDFVKVEVKGASAERLLQLKELDFKGAYSESTSEVFDKHLSSEFHFCKIEILKGKYGNHRVFFKGSLHKLWNSLNGLTPENYSTYQYKGFNGNNFNYKGVAETIEVLSKLFDCPAEHLKLQNLEIGINLHVPFDPKLFVEGLIFHQGKRFTFDYDHNFGQAEHQRHFIKIYNKGFQFGLSQNILRVEVKWRKMTELAKYGVRTLADLTLDNLAILGGLLAKKFEKIVYYDFTIKTDSLLQYSNSHFWLSLPANRRDEHRKKLSRTIASKSDNLKKIVLSGILNEAKAVSCNL